MMRGDRMLVELWLWMILSFVAFVGIALIGPLWLAMLVTCSLLIVAFVRGWRFYYAPRSDYPELEQPRPRSTPRRYEGYGQAEYEHLRPRSRSSYRR